MRQPGRPSVLQVPRGEAREVALGPPSARLLDGRAGDGSVIGPSRSSITPPIRRLRSRWGGGERLHAADPAAAAALARGVWITPAAPGWISLAGPAPVSVEGAVVWGLGPGSGGGWITLAGLRMDQFGRPLTIQAT